MVQLAKRRAPRRKVSSHLKFGWIQDFGRRRSFVAAGGMFFRARIFFRLPKKIFSQAGGKNFLAYFFFRLARKIFRPAYFFFPQSRKLVPPARKIFPPTSKSREETGG